MSLVHKLTVVEPNFKLTVFAKVPEFLPHGTQNRYLTWKLTCILNSWIILSPV